MTRVFLAGAPSNERFAPRLLLLDLKMEVVGEATDWPGTIAQAPTLRTEMLVVDWGLLETTPGASLQEFRNTCPAAQVIVLINHPYAHQQAALSSGADAFICKSETSERVIELLRAAAGRIQVKK